MSLLEVKNLKKSFGDNVVLKDISFNVEKGEVLSIIGPSGSGKSTLLRCITDLETGWNIRFGVPELQLVPSSFCNEEYCKCSYKGSKKKQG